MSVPAQPSAVGEKSNPKLKRKRTELETNDQIQKRCYHPQMFFKVSATLCKRADELTCGDQVLDRDGRLTEVKWACQHPFGRERIVMLETPAAAPLLVSASHRIVRQTPGGEGEVLAQDLDDGDWIILGSTAKQVSVKHLDMETSAIELGFTNDASVEAFFIADGIVTKGQAVDESHRFANKCKEEGDTDNVRDSSKRRNRRSRHRFGAAMRALHRIRTPSPNES